jgi:hypothetical protein
LDGTHGLLAARHVRVPLACRCNDLSHSPPSLAATLLVAATSSPPEFACVRPFLVHRRQPTCGHDNCNEEEVKSAALAMQANGMQALGWTFVNLDDCWAATARDPATNALTWATDRFPSGLPALIDWLHTRGFSFGLCASKAKAPCEPCVVRLCGPPLATPAYAPTLLPSWCSCCCCLRASCRHQRWQRDVLLRRAPRSCARLAAPLRAGRGHVRWLGRRLHQIGLVW